MRLPLETLGTIAMTDGFDDEHEKGGLIHYLEPVIAGWRVVTLLQDADRDQALVYSFTLDGRVSRLAHLTVRVIPNLTVDEIIIAGDCWDRGLRSDRAG